MLIRARGLRPGVDIEIIYTGLRPGERLTEDLMGPEEGARPTSHPAIMEVISPPPLSREDLEWTIERLRALAAEGRADELVRALRKSVASRQPAAEEPSLTHVTRPVLPDQGQG